MFPYALDPVPGNATIGDCIRWMLLNMGLFQKDIDPIMDAVKATIETDETLRGRDILQDTKDGYPEQVIAIIWYIAKREALKWIDANRPTAWFRNVFAE